MRIWLALATMPLLAAPNDIQPLLAAYCIKCHAGASAQANLDLSTLPSGEAMLANRKMWLKVMDRVKAQEMPPAQPLPSPEEREFLVRWIDSAVNRLDWSKVKRPGHVTIPRLNRAEYDNTIRDLTGLDIRPARTFPEDTFGESGFNNDREGLFTSPLLAEKYLAAATEVVDQLKAARANPPLLTRKIEVETMLLTETGLRPAKYGYDVGAVQNTLYQYVRFPRSGEYKVRVRAWGHSQRAGTLAGAAVRVAGELKAQFVMGAEPEVHEATVHIPAGNHRFSLHFYPAVIEDKKGKPADRVTTSFDYAEIEEIPNPHGDGSLVFRKTPAETIATFARRAWRRPVTKEELSYLNGLHRKALERGDSADDAIGLPLEAVLVSPNFLFRTENNPKPGAAVKLDGYQLASRLSYFLWMSMPDEELTKLAASRKLHDPETLERQVRRMLADPRSRAFTSTFFSQWLGYRELGKSIVPDRGLFPTFNDAMRESAFGEANEFFASLFAEDAPLTRLIDANYTYLDETIARHYGIADVKGASLRRVPLADSNRGGILGMAAVLAATSTPVRTSPVIRGKWIMNTLLGEEIPPPPAALDLPAPNAETKSLTLRQRLELHRKAPQCAGCHRRMDPLGFGLENFDAIGRWRVHDNGQPVDSRGELSTGESFEGPVELKRVLLAREKDFVRNLSARMLRFALGRELRYHDQDAVERIAAAMSRKGNRATVLVSGIVKSFPFQYQGSPKAEEE